MTIAFSLIAVLIFSQHGTEKPYIGVADAYIISLEFKQLLYQHKCICGMDGINDSESCLLYEVSIDSVLLSRDTTVYTSDDLQKVRYAVVSSKEPLKLGKDYMAFSSNSTTQKYIVINSLINTGAGYEYASTMPVFTGLVSCYKYSIWQRIAILFGANKEKVNTVAGDKFNRRNPFIEAIKKNER